MKVPACYILALGLATSSLGCRKMGFGTKSEIGANPGAKRIPLGNGYMAELGLFMPGSCVEGDQYQVYRPSAELNSGFSADDTESSNSVSLSGDAHGNVSGIDVSGHLQIDTSLADTALSQKYYTTFTYIGGNVVLLQPKLSATGLQAAANSAPFGRLAICGNEHLYQVELGGKFRAGVQYTFASHDMKSKFSGWISAKDPTGTFKATFELPSQGLGVGAITGTARLMLHQEGGDLTAFNTIKQRINPDCLSGVVVASVSAGNIEGAERSVLNGFQNCLTDYQNLVLPYARESFRTQIATLRYVAGNPDTNPGLNPMRYFTKTYLSSGFVDFQQDLALPQQLKDIMVQLGQAIARARQLLALLDSFDDLLNLPNVQISVFGNTATASGADLAAQARDRMVGYRQKLRGITDQATSDLPGCFAMIGDASLGKRATADTVSYCNQRLAYFSGAVADFVNGMTDADRALKDSLGIGG